MSTSPITSSLTFFEELVLTAVRPAPRPARADLTDPPLRSSRAGEMLQLVRAGTATTISALASATGLARSTVTERVELLVAAGLVVPRTAGAQGRGRPAAVFDFNATAGVVLTGQVGMSGLRVGVADLEGTIVATSATDVDLAAGPTVLLEHLQRAFDRALAEAGRDPAAVMGVGVGLPGRIELEATPGPAGGPDRPWLSHPLRTMLEEAYRVPVRVDRAVNLLASAEHRSFHRDATVLLGVKVGTVIECGVVIGGRPVGGGSGIAGEIGHTPVAGAEQVCACGNRGCLNAVASGAALVRDLAAAGHPVANAREVASLAARGDAPVGIAVRQAGRHVGEVLAGAVNLLNPDVIVVWGYLADGGDHLVAGLREGLYRTAVPAAGDHVRIEAARFGDDAALRGAATAVLDEALRPSRIDTVAARHS